MLAAAAALACSGWSSGPGEGPFEDLAEASLESSRVSVLVTGGIAGVWIRYTVDGEGPTWTVEGRDWYLCARVSPCPERRSGSLDPAVARELFAAVDGWFFRLRNDYGPTRDAADLFGYAVTVRRGEREKTVTGDDMSLPPPVIALVTEVRRVIYEADAP